MLRKNKYGGYCDLTGYSRSSDELKVRIYRTWYHMLERVNCKKYQAKFPTYVGCSVDDEWLYFSNFVRDIKNLPNYDSFKRDKGVRWSLDKDSLVPGNKHYGKNTCCFMLLSDNVIESNKRNDYGLISKKNSRKIKAVNAETGEVRFYDSATSAEKDGFSHQHISKVCSGKLKKHKGWIFSKV